MGNASNDTAAPVPSGVLLANLGSPDAPTPEALRRYLREFLWDPRIVKMPRPLWWIILHGIVLRTRPRRSAAAYRRIWRPEGSPLIEITRRQARALEARLARDGGPPVRVAIGMRYGTPSLRSGLSSLTEGGARTVLVLPMYPQSSGATTASTWDALDAALAAMPEPPRVLRVERFFDHPGYLRALAESIRRFRREHGAAEHLLMSFHGMPQAAVRAGDPYESECRATARSLAERLELSADRWSIAFQSRFGRAEWIRPYTVDVLKGLAAAGVSGVDVVCPGFPADCLETLDEIAVENREVFLGAGGRSYRYIPALNDDPLFIEALADLVRRPPGPEADGPGAPRSAP